MTCRKEYHVTPNYMGKEATQEEREKKKEETSARLECNESYERSLIKTINDE